MFPLVKSWLQSGLTQKQFCATYQMPVHILAYWVGRYRKAQPGAIADKGEATTGKMSKKAIATEENIRKLPAKLKGVLLLNIIWSFFLSNESSNERNAKNDNPISIV